MKPLKVLLKRSAVTKNAGSGERGSVVDVTIFHVYSGQVSLLAPFPIPNFSMHRYLSSRELKSGFKRLKIKKCK